MQSLIWLGLFLFMPVLHANEEALTDHHKKGLSYLQQGDYERAIQSFSQELNPPVAFEIQSLLKSRLSQAMRFKFTPTVEENFTLYESNHVLKYYDKARRDYNKALNQDTDSMALDTLYRKAADIVNEQGKEHLNAQKLDLAHKSFHLALAFYPGFAKAYNNLGIMEYEKGKRAKISGGYDAQHYYMPFNQAVQWYNRAISLDSTVSGFYVNRGIIFSDLKNGYSATSATQDFDKAIQLDPLSTSAYINRGIFHNLQGQGELAIHYLNKALELLQQSPKRSLNHDIDMVAIAYYNRGLAYDNLRQWESAIADYQSALQTPMLSSLPPEKGVINFIRRTFITTPTLLNWITIDSGDFRHDFKLVVERSLKKAQKAQDKAQQKPNRFFSFCARVFSG